MTQCAEHVTYQLPNEYTRVTFLLDTIETDAALQAAMALCRKDTGPNTKRYWSQRATLQFRADCHVHPPT